MKVMTMCTHVSIVRRLLKKIIQNPTLNEDLDDDSIIKTLFINVIIL